MRAEHVLKPSGTALGRAAQERRLEVTEVPADLVHAPLRLHVPHLPRSSGSELSGSQFFRSQQVDNLVEASFPSPTTLTSSVEQFDERYERGGTVQW
jgi:hypothetical protein